MASPAFVPQPDRSFAQDFAKRQAHQKRIDGLIKHYEYLVQSQQSWLATRAKHRLRWENDPSLVRRLKGPLPGEQQTINNVVNARPALRDWQHVLVSPHGFVNEQSRTEQMANLIQETTPRFSVRGRQLEDMRGERPLESLVDFELAVLNPVTEWGREGFSRGYVQGVAPMRASYRAEYQQMMLGVRPWDVQRFRQRLGLAMRVLAEDKASRDAEALQPPNVDPRTGLYAGQSEADLMAYVRWASAIRERYGIEVPLPPVARQLLVARNVGVKLDHLELPDLTWDPKIPTLRDQRRIYQRRVESKAVLLKECAKRNAALQKRGEQPVYDLAAINALPQGISVSGKDYTSTQDYLNEVLMAIGYYDNPISDPTMEDAVEIIEAWEPGAVEEGYGWCWIGQRKTALTRAGYFPHEIAVHPYVMHVHIPSPGLSTGRSSYDYNTADHDHLDTMRGLMADYVSVLVGQPLYRKGTGLIGETGRDFEIRPFAVLDLPMGLDEIGPVYNVREQLNTVMEYLSYCKAEIDEGNAMSAASRGQDAALARVGVGEVQLRAQNQQARPRGELYRFGTMCTRDLIPLTVMLVHQNGEPSHVENVAGADPFELMATDTLWPGLQADYMTMPSVLMAETALAVQQLQETIKTGLETGSLAQGGKAILQLFGQLLSYHRVKGADQIMAQAEQDLAEAQSRGQAEKAAQEAQQQSGLIQAENDKLRTKMGLLSAAAMQAELDALNAAQQAPPPQQGQLPPGEPEGDEGAMPPPEQAGPPPAEEPMP